MNTTPTFDTEQNQKPPENSRSIRNPYYGKPRRVKIEGRPPQSADNAIGFAFCLDIGGFPEALRQGNIYPVLADEEMAQNGWTWIIDEQGESLFYKSSLFIALELPEPAENVMRHLNRTA